MREGLAEPFDGTRFSGVGGFDRGEQERQHGEERKWRREANGVAPPVGMIADYFARNSARMQTFGERHTDDGLDEDLAGSAGIAADGFGGFVADETDAEGGAEKTECAGDVASDFSEEDGHGGGWFFVGCSCRRAHAKHAPGDKVLMWSVGGVTTIVFMVIAMITDKADIDGGEQGENDGLDQADEELHEIENEEEAGAVQKVFTTEDIAEETDGKGKWADHDRENLNEADDQEDEGKNRIEPAGSF